MPPVSRGTAITVGYRCLIQVFKKYSAIRGKEQFDQPAGQLAHAGFPADSFVDGHLYPMALARASTGGPERLKCAHAEP